MDEGVALVELDAKRERPGAPSRDFHSRHARRRLLQLGRFSFVGRQKAEAIDLARVLQDLPPALHAWEEMGDLAERRLPRFDSELAIVVGGVPDLEGIFDDFPHHHRDRNYTEIVLRDGIRLVPGCVPVQQGGSRQPSNVLLVIYRRDQALVTAVLQGRRPGCRRWESNDPGRRQSPARDGDGDRRPLRAG